MPLVTAPATITVATASGNTVFSLIEVNDSSFMYRAATVGGATLTSVKDQPILTISRRAATKANPNVKYDFVLDCASYDALGAVVGRSRHQYTLTEGANYVPPVADASHDELAKALGLVLSNSDIQTMVTDGAFVR